MTGPAEIPAVGDGGPVLKKTITRRDIVRYAGASGDFNPLHYDDEYAENAGYDGVIAHGMLTAGIASHVVSDWFGVGAVRSFSTRFVDVVAPGDTVTATGEVTAVEDEGERVVVDVELDVTNQDDDRVLAGSATAVLRP
jgi:acyl dehydratase